ncbi:hypothetical protein BS78_09G117400 [Paspalum vaginatum]|nr:hypothetical protein BS78_09G117400 [Paspalum vaginatum]
MDSVLPSLAQLCTRLRLAREQLSIDVPMEEKQMQNPDVCILLSLSAWRTPNHTGELIFREFTNRRIGIIHALTKGTGSLYLYGNIDGSWEVRQPDPKAMFGIKIVRGDMKCINWLKEIAMHGDSWLVDISFSLGQNMGTKERERLFMRITSLPTVLETFLDSDTYRCLRYVEEKAKLPTRPVIERSNHTERRDEAPSDQIVCASCDGHYHANAFWICCDVCNEWYHGKCVKITAKQADRIRQYECPECFSERSGHA